VQVFYDSGARVAIGTDSLASVGSLDMFEELACAHAIAPGVAPRRLLESATRVGADALGCGGEFGTIAPGKRALFAVVDVPGGIADVEEYLVSGGARRAVRRMDAVDGWSAA
jgi:cytosine/adenosine deaminase-related metal-dependent hydrolase